MNLQSIKPSRICIRCGHILPKSYGDSLCADCKEEALYQEVKEYIQLHTVTELEVAQHFQLPLATIRKWVREGRIDYRPTGSKWE